jgi:micrococcal nuclease
MGQVIRFRRRWKRPPTLRSLRRKALAALIGAALAAVGVATAGYHDTSTGVGTSGSGAFGHCSRTNRQTCVVDGDTLHYRGQKIRLADIDTPEVSEPKCSSEAALGQQATQRLVQLMNDGRFELVHRSGPDEDRYGRKLRVIERHGRSLGDTLIAEGLARRWDGARRSWCG